MILTLKQEEALKICINRYKNKEPYTCIAGYAGTGKSTVVRFIISALGLEPKQVRYITFTGKAASVLQKMGNKNAMTAHKLLYESRRLPNGKFINKPVEHLSNEIKLIIVDEISMLPKILWELLLSHKIPIIALGDPFQLPPISKEGDNEILNKPHIFLDEVMRQAQESEIVRISMDIRNYKPLSLFKGNEVHICKSNEVVTGMYNWADIILTGTNKKRYNINKEMRALLDRKSDIPQNGDKVICLRNDWDILSSNENALVNGTIGYLNDIKEEYFIYPFKTGRKKIKYLNTNLILDDNESYYDVKLDIGTLTSGEKTLTPQEEYLISKNKNYWFLLPLEFNYGYAITVHRAQGSQWNKVMVFEENFPFNKEEHARWLYTSVTRAIDKLLLVLK